jgi:hypothetical protein
MHYKNGREAKLGDQVLVSYNNAPFIGLLTEANAGSTTCNGKVIPLPINSQVYVTIGDVLHVDDALVKFVPPTPSVSQ